MTGFPQLRLRRLRHHSALRALVRETSLEVSDLIYPLFIKGERGARQPIASMPGIDQIPLSHLAAEIEELLGLGIRSVILFGVPAYKDATGSAALQEKGVIQEALRCIRGVSEEMLTVVDLCLCEYTDHGHCGVLRGQHVDNDETLLLLTEQALSLARAGAHVIAPSGMMDGVVQTLRVALDREGFAQIPLLSYSVKYHSAFYGPFRQAAEGAPRFGDRATHQMDSANSCEALREVALDVHEGADLLMVKPAHTYLDVICRVKQAHPLIPLGAYHTSGEFALLKAAAERGWVDEKKAVAEVLHSIRRAGADFILTYYAKEYARWVASGEL